VQVARAVHAATGGQVLHERDGHDLTAEQLRARRLLALNLLSLEAGWAPTLAFWEVRTTAPPVCYGLLPDMPPAAAVLR
jgi:hypothetical protein